MRNLITFIVFSFFAFLCACSPKPPEHYVALYLESPAKGGSFELQRSFVLPVVDKEVRVGREPVFNIDAFSDCLVHEKYDETFNRSVPGLFFRIKDEFALRLRQISVSGEGRRLILVADGKPLGFCTIKRDFTRNDLFFFIMTTATGEQLRRQLEDLCFDLNSFSLEFREYKENV